MEKIVIDWILTPLVHVGFPIVDQSDVPIPVQYLPKYRDLCVVNDPVEALELLIASAIETADLTEKIRPAIPGSPFVQVVRAGRVGFLKRYFGLTPDTAGLHFARRMPLAREFLKSKPDMEWPGRGRTFTEPSWWSYTSSDGYLQSWLDSSRFLDDLATELCTGAPERSDLPSQRELARALNKVLKKGLPLDKQAATPELLAFLPAVPHAESESERLDRMDRHLREQLEVFDMGDLKRVAQIFFCVSPGSKGTSMEQRQDKIGMVLSKGRSNYNIRTGVRTRILEAFAWQLYRAKLKESGQSGR